MKKLQKQRRTDIWLLIAAVAILICAVLVSMAIRNVPGPKAENNVNMWLTTPDPANRLTQQTPIRWDKDNSKENAANADTLTIEIKPDIHYQTMEGFGAAVSGSSAYLMNHGMSANQRDQLLNDLFTASGIQLSYIRHTIGASDYSLDEQGQPGSYTYDDVATGKDYELNHFSIAKDRDVIDVLKQILRRNQDLKIMGTPWTAPPWMKYGEQIYNGWYLDYTDPRVYQAYADYFVRYLQAYANEGIPIQAISIQNEPEFTTPKYPSMSMGAAEQANFIKQYLGPTLNRNHLSTHIIAFDHNWDTGSEYAKTVLGDEQARNYTHGTAFHCYKGEPTAMTDVHNAFPDKPVYMTECSGGAWSPGFGDNLSWDMSKLIIGAPRNWSQNVLFWNIALDPSGGPTNGGCANCRGVVTIDPLSGAVTKNVEYYAIGHASKFVRPGAVRIDSTHYSGSIETVAYRNPDGTLVLIAANTGENTKTFKVRHGNKVFKSTLPSKSAATFQWNPTAS
ncbi:glycoside hydrolase family 30 protein [Paenibacillus polymyxa]|uniref:Beta-1,6-glucanase n=1 Tax=Paenibacillus polymyxa TaxID=1406 RepID=A0AAE9L6U0_PAEPO|nr:glycoside hydrolase family 30 beta sandwich domain-containing protein [Paenibacillus polymyxa]URJ48662.1 glycoside hydrolase family 30 beta sandwich domain-containing protein [Paenibacillus polymyxa]